MAKDKGYYTIDNSDYGYQDKRQVSGIRMKDLKPYSRRECGI
jgi:hypothetical protein